MFKMKIYCIFLLLWLLYPKKIAGTTNQKIDQYLNKKSIYLNRKINEKLRFIRDATTNSTVEPTLLGPYETPNNASNNVHIFTFFNKTFFAFGDKIYVKSLEELFKLEFYGNFNENITNIRFFKTLEYQNTGFIALGVNDEILIYTLNKNSPSFEQIQSILTPFNTDAIFFINRGQLHLAAVSNHGEHIGYITFFKLLGNHFDETQTIYTNGPIFLDSFSYKDSEIILVGQSLPGKTKIHSTVYKFKDNQAKKKLYLNTNKPTHSDIYFQNGVPYVLIYEEERQQLFKWNGFEMVLLKTFLWEHKLDKSIIVYSKATPLIVQPQLHNAVDKITSGFTWNTQIFWFSDKILVYRPHGDDLTLQGTEEYLRNYSVILDINKGENENGSISFIAGLNEDNIINIYAMSFKVQAEMEKQQDEVLSKCFINLEQKVYDRKEKLNQMKSTLSSQISNSREKNINRKRQAADVLITDVTNIKNKLEDMKSRLDKVKPIVINQEDPNDVVVDSSFVIHGDLIAKNVTARNLDIKDINDKKWLPDQWLRYNETQTITGPSKIDKLIAKTLIIKEDTVFKNILLNQNDQTLKGRVKIENLTATEVITSKINDIDVENIYVKSNPVKIEGLKVFDNVRVKRAQVNYINNVPNPDILSFLQNNGSDLQTFASELFIENLEVESIDGINWNKFEESVFKIGVDQTLEGNLVLPEIIMNNTNVKFLNGINTSHLMTTSTDQYINSSVEFNNIKTSNINCHTVNDINITKSAAVDADGTVIRGPVRIAEIHVKNDLNVTGNLNQSLIVNGTDRVWGTNESDLIQRYVGKVVINGDLYVKDLSLLPNTTIFVDDKQFFLNDFDKYWTKSTDQVIPVHVKALNGVTTPHLKTVGLNNISMDNLVLQNDLSTIQGPLYFENVTVNGNVILNKANNNHSIDLEKLAREGVKNDGKTYIIKGKKIFENGLKVKHLKTDSLNGEKIDEYKIKSMPRAIKKYKRLTVKGDLISDIETETINGVDIEKYRNNIIPLNKPQNLTDIAFKNVSVKNLYVNTINGYSVNDYLEKLGNILSQKKINTVTIEGNVTIKDVKNVESINGHNVKEFLQKEAPAEDSEADLTGDVKFTGEVKLGNLRAENINGIDFPELTRRLFYKTANQTVTGVFTFTNLKTKHLHTPKINNINVENLIDVSLKDPQELFAPEGIILRNANFEKSLTASQMMPCDLHEAISKIKSPRSQEWDKIEITGSVKLMDENCVLNRILEKTVKKDEENVILAPVTVHGHVLANRVKLFGKLNNINLTELIEDAVLIDSEDEQIITGHKTFPKINAVTVTVLENADIPVVNGVYIPELYKRIIHKKVVNNITIWGKKTFFAGLQTDKFISKKVSGIKPENIINSASLSQISTAVFDSLEISNDLNVKFINEYDLNYILNNRLLVDSLSKQVTNAICFFDNLEIKNNLITPIINDIDLENVVFDLDKQKIAVPKRFMQNITIFGNVSIGHLNGIDLSAAYNNALVHGRDEYINGSITILKPVRIEGNITAQSINGYPIEKIKTILDASRSSADENIIFNTTQKVKNIILETLPSVQHIPSEFMYIERSEDLQIKIRNALDARVTVIKDYALIHVLSEESHIKCNLPKGCKCPVQHTVEITPHLSVSYFLNKGQQRIYSYDDDTMTIHLISNSISTDSYCRQENTFNEVSSITWSTTSSSNTTGSFNMYQSSFTGYISGVEFFTLKGATYAIIARYYDPTTDSHDLDCTVIKFSSDKNTAVEIQKIPTQGVWTLYILHTAQGVTLIIGNLAGQPHTEIYRFREDKQQFEILRKVEHGCTKAVGVALGTDSLIVLSDKNEPLKVLKYDSHYDNYYYYQMITLEEPVIGISVFYIGGFGISDAYLCVVTEDRYQIYSFQYVDGWKLESTGYINGLRNLIPLELNNQLYLFAPSSDESSLLSVVKYGASQT